MNSHYSETRCIARRQGMIDAANRHGNEEEAAFHTAKLAEAREILLARGIPAAAIARAIQYPTYTR